MEGTGRGLSKHTACDDAQEHRLHPLRSGARTAHRKKQSDYEPYRRDEGPKEPFYKPCGWVESTPAPAYEPYRWRKEAWNDGLDSNIYVERGADRDTELTATEKVNKKLDALAQANEWIHKSSESYEGKEALAEIAKLCASAGFGTVSTIAILKGLTKAVPAAGATAGGISAAVMASSGLSGLALRAFTTTSTYSQLINAIKNYLDKRGFTRAQYSFADTGTWLDKALSFYGRYTDRYRISYLY